MQRSEDSDELPAELANIGDPHDKEETGSEAIEGHEGIEVEKLQQRDEDRQQVLPDWRLDRNDRVRLEHRQGAQE